MSTPINFQSGTVGKLEIERPSKVVAPKPPGPWEEFEFVQRWEPDPSNVKITVNNDDIPQETLEEILVACRTNTPIEISFWGPDEKRWVYPDWVWWIPKPENECYYRFLNAGHEEVTRSRFTIPQAILSLAPDSFPGRLSIMVSGEASYEEGLVPVNA